MALQLGLDGIDRGLDLPSVGAATLTDLAREEQERSGLDGGGIGAEGSLGAVMAQAR